MNKEKINSTKLFTAFIFTLIVVVSLSSYVRYIFAKEYEFHIEMPCNSKTEFCNIRDCDDYCPPNGLDEYKVYKIPALLFRSCSDNSCSNICVGTNKCQLIKCDAESGDTCRNI